MSNNNAIQILRTNGITDTNKEVELLDGQPFYNKQKNYLTVGDGTKTANGLPITVPTVEGWFDDIGQPSSTEGQTEKYLANIGGNATDTNKYYIKPSRHYFNKNSVADMLEIHSPGIHLDGAVKVKGQIDFGEDNPNIDYNARINSYLDTNEITPILKINSNRRAVDSEDNETITPGKVDIFGGSGIRLSSTSTGSNTDSLTGATINIKGSSGDTDTRLIDIAANNVDIKSTLNIISNTPTLNLKVENIIKANIAYDTTLDAIAFDFPA